MLIPPYLEFYLIILPNTGKYTLSAKTRLGDAKYDEWQVYRQALRDMPDKGCTDLDNPVWPIIPV